MLLSAQLHVQDIQSLLSAAQVALGLPSLLALFAVALPSSSYPHWSLDLTHKAMEFILWALPSGCLPGTLVQSMVKNLEKQLEAPVKKPAGGVSLFSMPNAGPQRSAVPGRKPQVGCRTLGGYPAIPYRASSKFQVPGVGPVGGSWECPPWL